MSTRTRFTAGISNPLHPNYTPLNPRLAHADDAAHECACSHKDRTERLLYALAACTGKPVAALRVEFDA